jgi:hypothetical protein
MMLKMSRAAYFVVFGKTAEHMGLSGIARIALFSLASKCFLEMTWRHIRTSGPTAVRFQKR